MPEVDPTLLNAVLEELGQAVAADGGAAIYLADDDCVILLAASVGQAKAGSPGLIHRLLGRSGEADRRTLIMSLPGSTPGFVVLNAAQAATSRNRTERWPGSTCVAWARPARSSRARRGEVAGHASWRPSSESPRGLRVSPRSRRLPRRSAARRTRSSTTTRRRSS